MDGAEAMMKTIFAILILLLFVQGASAATYYVAKTGNDSTGDGSEGNPWLTIQKGINQSAAGDTVIVKAGDYNQKLTISAKSGGAGYIMIRAEYFNESSIINGSGISIPSNTADAGGGLVYINNSNYINISGFRIEKANGTVHSSGAGILVRGNQLTSHHIIIDSNRINDTSSSGIQVLGPANNITITRNNVSWHAHISIGKFSQEAISIGKDWSGVSNVVISNNRVHHNAYWYLGTYDCSGGNTCDGNEGIDVKDGTDGFLIFGNELDHLSNTWDMESALYVGVVTGDANNGTIYNNVVHDIKGIAYQLTSEGDDTTVGGDVSNITYYNNIAYKGNDVSDSHYGVGYRLLSEPPHSSGTFKNILIMNNIAYGFNHSTYYTYHWGMSVGDVGIIGTNVTVRNNIFTNNAKQLNVNTSYVLADHNLVNGSTYDNGTDNVSGNPMFVNASGFDFHLLSTSPAINAGNSSSAPALDFDGNARVGVADIGVYEYVGSAISFVDLTPPNASTISSNFVSINTSAICDTTFCSGWFDWNHTNVLNLHFEAGSGTVFEDSSSYMNNGTGNATWNTSGKFGNSTNFNNLRGIGVRNVTNPTTELTIEAWVYPIDYNAASPRIVSKEVTTTAAPYALEAETNYIALYGLRVSAPSAEYLLANSSTKPATYAWTHVVTVWNGTHGIFYFNGVQSGDVKNTSAASGGLTQNATNVTIGNNPLYNRGWNGSIDEVRIYNRALSADEVKASFNASANRLFKNFTNLSSGWNNVTAHIQNGDGDVTSTETREFLVDLITPAIAFVSPPTPANASTDSDGDININTSTECYVCSAWLNWNNTLLRDLRLNGTGNDSSVYVANGTINGAIVNTSGKFGSAMSFDGVDDNITFVDTPETRMTGGGTIAAWVYPLSLGELSAGRIIDKGTNATARDGYSLKLGTFNTVVFTVNGSAAASSTNSTANAITLSAWNHVIVRFNGSGRSIWVNGINVTNLNPNLTALPPNVAGVVSIGNNASASDRTFDGLIDDLKIFNRSLSDAEIKSLYDAYANSLNTTITGLGDGVYTFQAFVQNSTGAVNQTELRIVTVDTLPEYIPPSPTSLSNTEGNFFVNWTWQAGAGNITNSYNVSINGTWSNGSANTWSNATVSPHGWRNISVYAYNSSGTGTLNPTPISGTEQVNNNVPVLTLIGAQSGNEGTTISFSLTGTDADSDSFTCSSNETVGGLSGCTFEWITDFTDEGVYTWIFYLNDSYGGSDSEVVMITVNSMERIPPAPIWISNTVGFYWVNNSWQAGAGNITDSYMVKHNGTWYNGTATSLNLTIGAGNWSNITVWALNNSGPTTVSLTSISANTQVVFGAPTLSIVSPSDYIVTSSGTSITFSLTSDQPTMSSYTWTVDGAAVSGTDTYSEAWTKGLHYVKAYGTNDNGVSNTVEWRVSVSRLLAVSPVATVNESNYLLMKNATRNKEAENMLDYSTLPYRDVLDDLFWLFMWLMIFVAYWIRQRKMTFPTVIAVVFAGVFIAMIPEEYQPYARGLIAIGFVAVIISLFTKRGEP